MEREEIEKGLELCAKLRRDAIKEHGEDGAEVLLSFIEGIKASLLLHKEEEDE